MAEVVLCPPVPAVQIHHDREGSFVLRQTNLTELIGIASVSEAGIGWRWRKRENIFRGHEHSLSTSRAPPKSDSKLSAGVSEPSATIDS